MTNIPKTKIPKHYDGKKYDGLKHWGYRRDPPHAEARKLYTKKVLKALPTSFILPDTTAVNDQGRLGSCTSNAYEHANRLRSFLVGGPVFQGARLPHYYEERGHEGTLDQGDCGSSLSTAIWVGQNFGMAHESLSPYNITKYQEAPRSNVILDGKKDRLLTQVNLDADDEHITISNIKTALYGSYDTNSWVGCYVPIIGMNVYDQINSVGSDGDLKMPGPHNPLDGGHALTIIGWDDMHINHFDSAIGAFIFKNSWGIDFGMPGPIPDAKLGGSQNPGGYLYVGYEYFLDTDDAVGDVHALVMESDFPQ